MIFEWHKPRNWPLHWNFRHFRRRRRIFVNDLFSLHPHTWSIIHNTLCWMNNFEKCVNPVKTLSSHQDVTGTRASRKIRKFHGRVERAYNGKKKMPRTRRRRHNVIPGAYLRSNQSSISVDSSVSKRFSSATEQAPGRTAVPLLTQIRRHTRFFVTHKRPLLLRSRNSFTNSSPRLLYTCSLYLRRPQTFHLRNFSVHIPGELKKVEKKNFISLIQSTNLCHHWGSLLFY